MWTSEETWGWDYSYLTCSGKFSRVGTKTVAHLEVLSRLISNSLTVVGDMQWMVVACLCFFVIIFFSGSCRSLSQDRILWQTLRRVLVANIRQVFLKPCVSCQKVDGSWYFVNSDILFLRGIIDVVVACLHLIAKRKLIEQACSDYILQDTYCIWTQ